MTQDPGRDEVVYSTKWFQLIARHYSGSAEPHYLIHSTDFVVIVAVNRKGQLLLVRQFRPAIGGVSLELPSGHVEEGETPEQAARKELLEETGHVADTFELLTTLSPAIGRFTNRMWCYFAKDARPTKDPKHKVEEGIELVLHKGPLAPLLADKGFCSSLTCAALLAAVLRGKIRVENPR